MSEEKKDNWHLVREIPITLVFLILVQTASGLWWAATLTNKLDNLYGQILDLKAERYTKAEAVKDISLNNIKIDNLERRLEVLENKKR